MGQTWRAKFRWRVWERGKYVLAKKGLWPSDWVPDGFRRQLTRHRVGAGVVILIAVLVFAVLNSRLSWGFQWGNLSGWFAAVASAAVAVTLAYVTHHRDEREGLMAAELNAARVALRIQPTYEGSEPVEWKMTITNNSGGPIFNVKYGPMHAFGVGEVISPVPGITLDPRPAIGEYALEDKETLDITFQPTDADLVARLHPFPRVTFTDPYGFVFLSVYPNRQTLQAGSIAVWRYLERRAARPGSIFVPPPER